MSMLIARGEKMLSAGIVTDGQERRNKKEYKIVMHVTVHAGSVNG